MLFALTTEPLIRGFINLNRIGKIEDIQINDSVLNMKMFADDTVIITRADENQVNCSRDDWPVAKVRDKLGKWSRNHLSTAGRLVILNHMIGGLLNFYLGIWSLSK